MMAGMCCAAGMWRTQPGCGARLHVNKKFGGRGSVTEFVIGNTNFGVDPTKSSFKLLPKPLGRVVLDVEINGDQSAYEAVSTAEDSEWFWTLYPPRFYAYTELERTTEGHELTVQFSAAEIESAEMALYMMNHNHVTDVILMIHGNRLTVSGSVDLMGQPAAFRIDWSR
jgi:hypothetical protein